MSANCTVQSAISNATHPPCDNDVRREYANQTNQSFDLICVHTSYTATKNKRYSHIQVRISCIFCKGARRAERSGDVQQNAGATVAVARTMAGFMSVGIVDRSAGVNGDGNVRDVPESILSVGVRP